MVGSPLAGIFGGIPYYKSNADPAAGYYFAQYGMALEGIGAGVLGLPTGPLAGPGWRAALESPNTFYVGSGAGSALPTWTNVAGPYSAVGQGGGAATTVQPVAGYVANGTQRVGSSNSSGNSVATEGQSGANTAITYPDGLAYRVDLPVHLAGPDGFTKSGQLSGTHNLQNATAALDAQGAIYNLIPTGTAGISELKYSYTNAAGKTVIGSKTVYDPAVYSDQAVLNMSQAVGQRGYQMYLQNPSQRMFDINEGGVNFRVYINTDPKSGLSYVGNVHPIK
ncbi:hypothetical protein HF906_04840 [Ralstonia solanacearum]|nr:hypothetical protein HF906_04840 [Ralstonia solanacearum]